MSVEIDDVQHCESWDVLSGYVDGQRASVSVDTRNGSSKAWALRGRVNELDRMIVDLRNQRMLLVHRLEELGEQVDN